MGRSVRSGLIHNIPDSPEFREEVAGLVDVLAKARRPLHVLLVGMGPGKANVILPRVYEAGCTASLVTTSPVIEAIEGGRRFMRDDHFSLRPVPDRQTSRKDLALPNLEATISYLQALRASLTI